MIIKDHEEFVKSLDFFCSKFATISNTLIIQDRLRDIVSLTEVLLKNTINKKYLLSEKNAKEVLKSNFEKLRTEIEINIGKQSRLVVNFQIMSSIRGNPCQNFDSDKVKQLCPPPESSSSSIATDSSSNSIHSVDKISIHSSNEDPECFSVLHPLKTRMESIVHLETNFANLANQAVELKNEKERLALEISNKKAKLLNAIYEVIKLELSIREVEKVISDKLYHFQSRILELESKRFEEFKNNNQNQLSILLEQEIDEVKRSFQVQSTTDELSKNQLIQNAQNFAASLGDVVTEYEEHFNDQKNSQLITEFDENMKILKHLLTRPGQFCHDKNNARFYLNKKKEKVYQLNLHSSQYILDEDGNRSRINDGFELMENEKGKYYLDLRERHIYVMYYFEDSFGRYYVDVNGDRFYKGDPEASEYMLVNGQWTKTKDGTYEKDEKGQRIKVTSEEEQQIEIEHFDLTTEEGRKAQMKSNDLNYIKETVGPAIKKALAAIVIHQPSDPISYFANFLLQYRYNQRMFEYRDQELLRYLQKRKEIQDKENNYCCLDRKVSKLNSNSTK